jgi:hypothetical protein
VVRAMNKTYALPEDELRGEIYRRIYLLVKKEGGGWHAAGAAFSLGAGVLSIPLALALWAAAKFVGPVGAGPTLLSLSTVLFVLTIPLLTAGAVFLDLLEKRLPYLPLPAKPRPAVVELRRRHRARRPPPQLTASHILDSRTMRLTGARGEQITIALHADDKVSESDLLLLPGENCDLDRIRGIMQDTPRGG